MIPFAAPVPLGCLTKAPAGPILWGSSRGALMPMPDPFDRRNRGIAGAILGGALIAAAVFLMECGRRPVETKSRETVFAAAGLPATPMPAAVRAPVRGALQPPVLDSTDFDKLVELFKGTSDVPATQEFAREFMAQPDLKRAWDDFEADQKSPEPKETLETFARFVSEKAEFRQLVARYSQDPGFRDAALRLSQNPQVKEAMQAVLASARVAPPALRPGATIARAATGRSQPGTAAQAALASGARQAQYARGSTAGSTLDSSEAASAQSRAKGGSAGGGDTDTSGGPRKVNLGGETDAVGGKSGNAGGAGSSGPDAHNVPTKLDYDKTDSSEAMDKVLKDWLARHGLKPEDFLDDPTSGIWDRCFLLGKLKDCHDACENQPTTISTKAREYCRKPSGDNPYWSACLQAYNDNEVACLAECQAQEPCAVPDDMIVKYCFKAITTPQCTAQDKRNAYLSLKPQCGVLRDQDPGGVKCAKTNGDPDDDDGVDPATGKYKRAILGFTYEPDGKLKPVAKEMKIVREIYQLFRDLRDVDEVARRISKKYDKADFNNKGGDKIYSNQISQLLKRPHYAKELGKLNEQVKAIYKADGFHENDSKAKPFNRPEPKPSPVGGKPLLTE